MCTDAVVSTQVSQANIAQLTLDMNGSTEGDSLGLMETQSVRKLVLQRSREVVK